MYCAPESERKPLSTLVSQIFRVPVRTRFISSALVGPVYMSVRSDRQRNKHSDFLLVLVATNRRRLYNRILLKLSSTRKELQG